MAELRTFFVQVTGQCSLREYWKTKPRETMPSVEEAVELLDAGELEFVAEESVEDTEHSRGVSSVATELDPDSFTLTSLLQSESIAREIFELMNGREWSMDTVDDIAAVFLRHHKRLAPAGGVSSESRECRECGAAPGEDCRHRPGVR